MAETTGIQWCHSTWNPWMGCHKVSPGCKNCYMFREQKIYGYDPNVVRRAANATFNNPIFWAKSGKVAPGSRIFTCSWSDWFIEEADEWRGEAWKIIKATPQFNYLILTKRPERILTNLPYDWGEGGYPNVWLGISAEDQKNADKRIPILTMVPVITRFVSAEPLLGAIDLRPYLVGLDAIDWVITGGESDFKNPRPCNPDWVRDIRDQCQVAKVAFFHKQNGGSRKVGGTWGGRELDGRTWDEFPI